MPLIIFIIGFFAGLLAGMIVGAGSWRKALGKLGRYATDAANEPPAERAAPAANTLAAETMPPVSTSLY